MKGQFRGDLTHLGGNLIRIQRFFQLFLKFIVLYRLFLAFARVLVGSQGRRLFKYFEFGIVLRSLRVESSFFTLVPLTRLISYFEFADCQG